MNEKNSFENVQRLNSTIMAKSKWTSSLIGMRKSGEELHDRRTKSNRKANQFLQELLQQKSDGSQIDDNGVTDRYHKFLRNKSNLNNDNYVLDEFEIRLRALNNQRRIQTSRSFHSSSDVSFTNDSEMENEIEYDNNDLIQNRNTLNQYGLSSKSTSKSTLDNINSNVFSNLSSPNKNQTNTDENQLSSDEASSMSTLNNSMTQTSLKPISRQINENEDNEKALTKVLHKTEVKQDDMNKESSKGSLNRSGTKFIPDENQLSSDEASSMSTLNNSMTQTSLKPISRQINENEDNEKALTKVLHKTEVKQDDMNKESSKGSLNRSGTKFIPKPKIQRTHSNEDIEKSSRKIIHKPNARQNDDSQQIEEPLQTSTIPKSVHKPNTRQNDSNQQIEEPSPTSTITKSVHKTNAQQNNDNQQMEEPLPTSTIPKSIPKPITYQSNDSEDVEKPSKFPLNRSIPKPLYKSKVQSTDSSNHVKESSVSSSNHSTIKTMYKPIARRADGTEIVAVSTENSSENVSSNNLLFNQCYFPRSLFSQESRNTNDMSKIDLPLLQIEKYDSVQLYHLLSEIENECTPMNFTKMLDQLKLSSVQIRQTEDNNTSLSTDEEEDDDEDKENIDIIPNLFDQSSSSQEYYTTFTINIDDPRKISLYTMTIGTVQLCSEGVVPYSVLSGHRPLLQRSEETKFKQVRSKRRKQTHHVAAIESFTNIENLQKNDIILNINDQSVWNLPTKIVRNYLLSASKQSNNCSLTIARLCKPLI
ncbi:unnamed protein product [Adineta steineri]|uniref:Uncharacterized protein n=1 Tax=Adineta steineri TaxID=433720 RepID=A0A815AVG9_9BILA|nr:unnamed protein product [Adineta steineri]